MCTDFIGMNRQRERIEREDGEKIKKVPLLMGDQPSEKIFEKRERERERESWLGKTIERNMC